MDIQTGPVILTQASNPQNHEMQFNRLSTIACAVAVSGAALVMPATAATVEVNTTLSVFDIVPTDDWTGAAEGSPPFSPFSVELEAGDTFEFTISFLQGQQLTIDNLSFIWAFSYADTVSDATGTGSLALLDANGDALLTSNVITGTEGSIHFGQQFSDSDFDNLPDSVTFSGLRYAGTLEAYSDPVVISRTYASPAFLFTADSFVASVPEPETIAMLIAGLGVVGAVARRRRKAEIS